MSHSHHPSIYENGLNDHCDRCTQIAEDPFIGLDPANLLLLHQRTLEWMSDREYARSDNELRAMRHMETAIRNAARLDELTKAGAA